MEKILKITLKKGDVEYINQFKDRVQGIEIQLLDLKPLRFDLLEKLEIPIKSIHIDLFTKEKLKEYEEKKLSPFKVQELIFNALSDDEERIEHLREIMQFCNDKKIMLLMHSGYSIDNFAKKKQEKIYRTIRGWINDFPNLNFYLENAGQLAKKSSSLILQAWEVPMFCKELNKRFNCERFYPLLDICHYYSAFAESLTFPPINIKDTISLYKSSKMALHFNYGIGNCSGKNHSVNFNSNPELCKKLLKKIHRVNPNARLILEVLEDDYKTRPNMIALLEMVERFEKELNL